MVLRHRAARDCATRRCSHLRGACRMDRKHRLAREHPAYGGHRSSRRAADAPNSADHEANPTDACAATGDPVMAAPKRRLTPAERDRGLRLRGRLTTGFGVLGTTAVALLAVVAAHTHAGSS